LRGARRATKQSRAVAALRTLWIAASPAAPRNDDARVTTTRKECAQDRLPWASLVTLALPIHRIHRRPCAGRGPSRGPELESDRIRKRQQSTRSEIGSCLRRSDGVLHPWGSASWQTLVRVDSL